MSQGAPPPSGFKSPGDAVWQVEIARQAMDFFSVLSRTNARLAGEYEGPLAVDAFLRHLSSTQLLDAHIRAPQIHRILRRLVSAGLLVDQGALTGPGPEGRGYIAVTPYTAAQWQGYLWLADALGSKVLIPAYGSVTVNVTGTDAHGDIKNGSGLLVGPRHILTNAHVVNDMTLSDQFELPSTPAPIPPTAEPYEQCLRKVDVHVHKEIDVAVIEVQAWGADPPLAGIAFRQPEWGDEAFVFGYPPVPTAAEAPLVVHRGEVVTPRVQGIDRQQYFLYSATVRPGNSGGPIVAQDGRVVGLVAHEAGNRAATRSAPASDQKAAEDIGETATEAPYYRGIPADQVLQAVTDLGLRDLITWEDWI